MLTEYSTYDDIRKFRDRVFEKLESMMDGWLGKKVDRLIVEWRRMHSSCRNETIVPFTFEKQKMYFSVSPIENSRGEMKKRNFCYTLRTHIETSKGKMTYFIDRDGINVGTPHYFKRQNERFKGDRIPLSNCLDYVPYIRNGRHYELEIADEFVNITRLIESDVRMFITLLSRDMCTSKNYQALLDRVGKRIDEDDIYIWK